MTVLQNYQGPREKPLRVTDIREMFLDGNMKFWIWLREALYPAGSPVFLAGVIGFQISILVSIYIRQTG